MSTFRTVSRYGILVAFAFTILYLFIGTGLHSDDYGEIINRKNQGVIDFFATSGFSLFGLGSYFGFWWAYPLLGFEHQWVYDLVKAVAHLLSLFFVYRFASDYLPHDRAMLSAAIFVFYPLHDTTMYWYMAVVYVFFPALLMYAHSLIRGDRIALGLFLLFIGTFAGYMSPPYVFGLACIFFFEHDYKKTALFTFPGILYIAYYFGIKYAFPDVERRINSSLSIVDFLKQLVLQPLSFFEAAIGPSYWLKIYYAIGSIGWFSVLIATGVVVFIFTKSNTFSGRPEFPKSLFVGLLSVLLLSFGVYALTGLYHHSAFNLGNRSTVYGSLLIAFMLAMLPLNKKTILFFTLIFILPVFGLSDYWKSWNVHQKQIIENIHTNSSLRDLERESTLLVTGNIYSKLGPFSHIEFFSMPWVVNTIFHYQVKSNDIIALVPYIYFDNGILIDSKLGGKYFLNKKIYVYNSDTNLVTRISATEVPKMLADRPPEIRHWVQLAKGTWIESSIVALSPRLAYLFL
ncbi:hypothetical protein HGB07_04850 [Candidatus Roizmanbacteria bacterium]|nr:hypothetical protein [Candidatus Roizmanbacteria bacterium]